MNKWIIGGLSAAGAVLLGTGLYVAANYEFTRKDEQEVTKRVRKDLQEEENEITPETEEEIDITFPASGDYNDFTQEQFDKWRDAMRQVVPGVKRIEEMVDCEFEQLLDDNRGVEVFDMNKMEYIANAKDWKLYTKETARAAIAAAGYQTEVKGMYYEDDQGNRFPVTPTRVTCGTCAFQVYINNNVKMEDRLG